MQNHLFVATVLTILSIVKFGSCFCLAGVFVGFPRSGQQCSNDPNDTQNLEVFYALEPQCDNGGVWRCFVLTTNTAGVTGSLEAVDTYTLPAVASQTLTFRFDMPITALQDGSRARVSIHATSGGNALDGGPNWTQSFISSIVYSTDTVTASETVGTITTTSSTLTVVETETSTPSVTVTAITGTKTIYASKVTTIKIITVTLPVRTIYSLSVVKTTKTVSCLGSRDVCRDCANKLKARQAPGGDALFEPPNCGAITTTTLPTVSITTETVTTTDISTTYFMTTSTTTETGPTSTVMTSVRTTTTITPSRVISRFSILPRSSTTVTKFITFTQTVYPNGKRTKPCGAQQPHWPPGQQWVDGKDCMTIKTR